MIKCLYLNTMRSHMRSLAHFLLLLFFFFFFYSFIVDQQWDTADAEIKAFSVENPERLKVFPLKPGVGQNIDMHASHIARNFFLSDSYMTSGPFKLFFSRPLYRFFPPCVRC